nr:hypothetical protein [Ktedonobacterales bacterium]
MGTKRGVIPLIFMVAVVLSGMLTACNGQSKAPARVTKDIRASSGGSISDTHGVTLTIPANALSGDAHVTLADTGQPAHAKGDPLGPISDSFTVTATPLTGNATITLTHPATLQIVTHPTQKGQDILVAEMASASQGEVHLHYALTIKNDIISARYGELGGREWAVFLPIALPQVTPTEGNVLQVPWYDQSGVSWCVPTSLAELLRYYDFNEKAGDPLNATFGPTTALANWQIAGQSHQAAGGGAGYDEAINIGLPSPMHSDSGGTEARITTYLWDDNFFFTAPGDTPATQDLTHYDFQDYVTLINTGVFGLAERKPVAMLVDAWYHSVVIVGVDSKGVFLHNSNGGIAVHMNWADLFTQAHTYRTDAAGKSNEIHTIWTGVVYNMPVKPLEKRTGSVVIKRDDVWFTDSTMSRVTLDWDGIGTHGAGYY